MIQLDKLSSIGLGTYRMAVESNENYKAIAKAISSGCNLVDTASSYTDGASEKLIGKYLKDNPEVDLFIVSKAGYISGDMIEEIKHSPDLLSELILISEDFQHSMHPAFLQHQINKSLKRLNRSFVDCYLLHSPEYFFKGINSTEKEYYHRIKKAFAFLEQKVKEKVIRYYGVSSNNLTLDPANLEGTNFKKLIDIATEVSSSNHFKFIQLPYNIIEPNAILICDQEGKSITQLSKEAGIKILGNRPFNANTSKGILRLITYKTNHLQFNNPKKLVAYNSFIKTITEKLKRVNPNYAVNDIAIIAYLQKNWMNIDSTDNFHKIFDTMLYPFLNVLYTGNIPKHVIRKYKRLEFISWQFHLRASTLKVKNYFAENNLIQFVTKRKSLQEILVEDYIRSGVDHVLIGLTKPKYVIDFERIINKTKRID